MKTIEERIVLPRLGITVFPTYIVADRWAFFSDSCMLECSRHARLHAAVLSLYGANDIIDIVPFTGMAWDEIDHKILSWFEARPTRMGWLSEMRAIQEVAA